MTTWYAGTMGFGYKQWQGVFYPEGLPARRQLAYYAGHFSAVEMDSTFHGIPSEETVARWRADTPAGFRISPKMPREITHVLRLSGVATQMELFLDTMRQLGQKLGPVLIQFPPDFTSAEREALAAFLPELPRDVRFAVEFRHRSWVGAETAVLLREHRVCWVAADYFHLPKELWLTTDFLFLRFLGRHGRYSTKTHEVEDRSADLLHWQRQFEPHLDQVKAGYAFFNNDYSGFSPATANRFLRMVGLEPSDIRLPQQGTLF